LDPPFSGARIRHGTIQVGRNVLLQYWWCAPVVSESTLLVAQGWVSTNSLCPDALGLNRGASQGPTLRRLAKPCGLPRETKEMAGIPDDDDDDEYYIPVFDCECCRAKGATVVIRRCKAVGYCGRDCQKKHWKMGHKADCQGVVTLQEKVQSMHDVTVTIEALLKGDIP
jgi:MYND finger